MKEMRMACGMAALLKNVMVGSAIGTCATQTLPSTSAKYGCATLLSISDMRLQNYMIISILGSASSIDTAT